MYEFKRRGTSCLRARVGTIGTSVKATSVLQTMTKFAAFCLVSCNISQNPCIFIYQNKEEKVIHVPEMCFT